MNAVYLSVIVPYSSRKGDKTCSQRLLNALKCFAGCPEIELVIYDTSSFKDIDLSKKIESFKGVSYFHQPLSGVFSPGATRNYAVKKAAGEYLFFYDADLLCSSEFSTTLVDRAKKLAVHGVHAFEMFPCLYLSQEETSNVLDGKISAYAEYLRSYLLGELRLVNGIAVASSCLLINKKWFLAVGQFRDEFSGYGCEDFDLIHRLSAYHPIGKLPEDYSLDFKSRFPSLYKGFRRYYSYYSLPNLFNNHFLLHQWHPRPVNKYHKSRADNESLQQLFLNESPGFDRSRLSGFTKLDELAPWQNDNALPEWHQWLEDLLKKHSYDSKEFCGLYQLADGVKEKGIGLRKMKKLLRNPKLFIKDAVKKINPPEKV